MGQVFNSGDSVVVQPQLKQSIERRKVVNLDDVLERQCQCFCRGKMHNVPLGLDSRGLWVIFLVLLLRFLVNLRRSQIKQCQACSLGRFSHHHIASTGRERLSSSLCDYVQLVNPVCASQ